MGLAVARPKDNETRKQIQRATFELFAEVGYAKTSYSAIAQRCGMTKALVQYYFKKKEDLAIDLMNMMLENCIDDLGYRNANSSEGARFEEMVRIGEEYFARILATNGYTQFLTDILASRELTETVLAFNAQWAFSYLDRPGDELSQAAIDTVVLSMGGFYELLYHTLKEGRTFDIPAHLSRVVNDFKEAVCKA